MANRTIELEMQAGRIPAKQNHSTETTAIPNTMPADRRPLRAPQAMCEAYHYSRPSAFSRGMEVDIGTARLIFISGTASIGPNGQTLHAEDFREQTRQAFENARVVLSNAGADWQNVVKVTIFLKDIAAYYETFNKVRCAYFEKIGVGIYPASTCVEARLCRDNLMVEMELIAVVRKNY